VEDTAPNPVGEGTSREAAMTTRTTRRGIFSRRMGVIAAAMGFVSFALGYLIHPM